MDSQTSRRQAIATAVAGLVGLAGVLQVSIAVDAEEVDDLIQRVVAQTTRSGIAVHATRHLEAGTVTGKHRGWMAVETIVAPSGTFTWHVISEGGSERTREKVFKAVLNAEAEASRAGARDETAISLANYRFVPMGGGAGRMRLQLEPLRADSKLVTGTLTVSADGHPILLEGQLAKSPSFWVRSVTVVKRYARVAGVSVPVVIESLADVKIFGKSSFLMRYNYSTVNGRTVGHRASALPSFGPSPQILALHAQFREGQ